MANIQVLAGDQSVLAIVRDADGGIESVTVFVPYSAYRKCPTRWDSHWGPVDIWYSWKSTYLMLDRLESGFVTGMPLPTESFTVLDRVEALKQAEAMYNACR